MTTMTMIYVPIDYQLMSESTSTEMMNKRAFRVGREMYEIGGSNEMIHEPAQ